MPVKAKTGVLFVFLYICKEIQKGSGQEDLNLKSFLFIGFSENRLFSRSSTIRPRGLEHVETVRHKSFGVLFAY